MSLLGVLAATTAITITATVACAIANELTKSERNRQSRMRSEYESYRRAREADLYGIAQDRANRMRDLHNYEAAERQRLRMEQRARFQEINRPYFDMMIGQLDEQRKVREELKQELQDTIHSLRRIYREGQNTLMRGHSLEQLGHSLEEALEKVKAYLNYLNRYERNLRYKYDHALELPSPFEMLLPETYPYTGKIIFLKKSSLHAKGSFQVAPELTSDYECVDAEHLSDFDDNAEIPVFVERFDRESRTYLLSSSKGLFKYMAIYQAGVGVEGTVLRHESNKRIILDFRGLTLELDRKHLENPRRTPPRGTKIRIFPIRWNYRLNYPPKVTERYQESYALHHFDHVPLVFPPDLFDEFSKHLEKHHLWDSQEEWKIAPYREADVPDVNEIKLQLGTELLIHGRICFDEQGRAYLLYQGLLPLDQRCKPEDIFVVSSATLKVLWADDTELIHSKDYETMNQFSLFLFHEFKMQKAIKESQAGITYFNKWAAVTDDLITYLYKGDSVTVETESIAYHSYDKKIDQRRYTGDVINYEAVQRFLRKRENAPFGRSYYFTITSDGRYLPVEFKPTGSQFQILGDYEESRNSNIEIYQKVFPYPEIQQKNALLVFREGRLANPKLKPFLLNAESIEPTGERVQLESFFNERIATNPYQREAVERALGEKNLFLIQGPPGTGKTTVIKEIILQHLKSHPGDRVLVVSQANVAVDNVLKDLYVDFHELLDTELIRCGKADKIDEEIQEISFETKYQDYLQKVAAIPETEQNRVFLQRWRNMVEKKNGGRYNSDISELLLKGHSIVGATCVGLAQRNIGLDRLVFDLVIIDEASKALPAEILIPVNRAKKVLLIGDHKQLPPTVHTALYDAEKIELEDREYVEEELFARSLFQRIFESCPDTNKTMLRTQYRMPASLGSLVSEQFYASQLENGIPTYEKEPVFFPRNLNWLDMSKDKTYREEKVNRALINRREADLVWEMIEQIRSVVDVDKRIAVITPYKGQRKEILSRFQSRGVNLFEWNVAINTIDAFQGDEAEIVLYCTTRSKQPTSFFSDLARLNVALSRAKHDLLIIGSIRYFEKYGEESALYRIANYIKKHGVVLLPKEIQRDGEAGNRMEAVTANNSN